MPSNATDAGSLLLAALDDPNPVLVLEHGCPKAEL